MVATAVKVGGMSRAEKDPDISEYSGRIAARLRALRKKRGLSREQLWARLEGEGIKISVVALYAYENGRRKLDPDLYPVFAKVLGCKGVRDFLPSE